MKKVILSFIGLSLMVACKDDKPETTSNPDTGSKNVWVLNEGNYSAGNSALGVYNLDSKEYSDNVFQTINNRQLGDVLQSATEIDGEVFLVVNNSGKIEVVNEETFESTGTISGLTSPRYVVQVSPSQALVSDLFSDSLAVIDPATKKITDYINISSSSEEMVKVGSKVFITNTYSTHITVLDLTDNSTSTITTTFNPSAIGTDKNGKVWVLCGGDATNSVNGALELINPSSESIENTIDLGSASYSNKLVFNTNGDSLYYMTGSVYKMPINATSAPTTPIIDGASFNYAIYGIGYDAANNELWIGDAKDFNQKGEVFIYSSSGNLKSSFGVNVNPNGFYIGE